MILPLRRLHRRLWRLLALFLLVLFVASLAARRPSVPGNRGLPGAEAGHE